MRFDESTLYNIYSKLNGKRYPLYDLALWKNGLAFKKIDFSDAGVPVIKIAELNNGISGNTSYTKQIFSDDVHLKKEDLLFSWSGNPQTSIDIFKFQLQEGWLNQHIFKVTPNEEIVDRDYFYFLMKYLKPWFTQIASNKQTTGLGHVTIADIKRMSVLVPSLTMQKKIVDVLKPINDKIQINASINKNLLEQAQSIFTQEFLMLDRIPDGWQESSLLGIADYLNGLAMQKYRPKDDEQGLPVIKIKELRQGSCDFNSELCSPSIKPEYIVHDGDVIFSWSGSLLVDLWCGGTCGLNQHLFKVTSSTYDKWFYYAWTNHHLQKFAAIAADMATTMGHIKREELSKAEVLIPSQSDYDRIGGLLAPLYDLVISNRIVNRKLASLRDELLPQLMSGQLDVSEVSLWTKRN